MNSTSLQTELSNLFEQRKFQSILERAQSDEISPANNPHASNIVAAALFQIGRFSDCLLWCEALSPSLSGNASFLSMYAVILRRLSLLTRSDEVFKKAMEIEPESREIKNNYSNLLIDQEKYNNAMELLDEIIKKHPFNNYTLAGFLLMSNFKVVGSTRAPTRPPSFSLGFAIKQAVLF